MDYEGLEYIDLMHSLGYRVTTQRMLILDAVYEGMGHSTLSQIHSRVTHMDPSISLSTVYRALKTFVKAGLVLSADIGTGERLYEVVKERPHHHTVCEQCGKVGWFGNQAAQPLFDWLEREHQFACKMDHIVIFGICSTCHQQPSADNN